MTITTATIHLDSDDPDRPHAVLAYVAEQDRYIAIINLGTTGTIIVKDPESAAALRQAAAEAGSLLRLEARGVTP